MNTIEVGNSNPIHKYYSLRMILIVEQLLTDYGIPCNQKEAIFIAPEEARGNLSKEYDIFDFAIIMWVLYVEKGNAENVYPGELEVAIISKVAAGLRPTIPLECPMWIKKLLER